MYVVDENLNIINDYDLSKGSLQPCIIVNPKATPVDNVKKFAWAAEDYIEAQMYLPNMATEPDRYQSQIDDINIVLADLMGGAL